MKYDAFSEGIIPGGLRSKQDIRVLICIIFTELNIPLRQEDIFESLQASGLVNYFELSDAFKELIETKTIEKTEKGTFFLTENGKLIAQEFKNSLPQSIKDNSMLSLRLHLERVKFEKENSVVIKKTEFGYNVCCTISGGNFPLFSFEIFAPDENCAQTIKNNFYNDPTHIYNVMLSALNKI